MEGNGGVGDVEEIVEGLEALFGGAAGLALALGEAGIVADFVVEMENAENEGVFEVGVLFGGEVEGHGGGNDECGMMNDEWGRGLEVFGEEGAEDAGEGGFVDFHAFAIVALEPEHAVGAAAQGEGREVYLGGGCR